MEFQKMMFDFTGKTAIITGAGSGMGKLQSECFAEMGANVVLCDINIDAAEEVAAAIRANGGKLNLLITDLPPSIR